MCPHWSSNHLDIWIIVCLALKFTFEGSKEEEWNSVEKYRWVEKKAKKSTSAKSWVVCHHHSLSNTHASINKTLCILAIPWRKLIRKLKVKKKIVFALTIFSNILHMCTSLLHSYTLAHALFTPLHMASMRDRFTTLKPFIDLILLATKVLWGTQLYQPGYVSPRG